MVGCCQRGREVVASWTDSSGVGHLRQQRQVLDGQRSCWMMLAGLLGYGGVIAVGARGGFVVIWRHRHCGCHGGLFCVKIADLPVI